MNHAHKLLALAVLSLVLSAGAASASHFTGMCATELNAVEQAITDAVYLGNRADSNESNLLVKLEAAAAKLAQEKPADAIDKLQDISDKVTAWANAPKAKIEDATGINDAVADAIACVAGL